MPHNRQIGLVGESKNRYFNIKILDSIGTNKYSRKCYMFILEDGRLGYFSSEDRIFELGGCYVILGNTYNTHHITNIDQNMCLPNFVVGLVRHFKHTLIGDNNLPTTYNIITEMLDNPKLVKSHS